MVKANAFISFDYDNDSNIKNLLVGQAKNQDSPFSIIDMSIKHEIADNWTKSARNRIKKSDVVIVLCGTCTNTASGVAEELKIAIEEKIPYFLLAGYENKKCIKPSSAKSSDKIYTWNWDNLKKLIAGQR